MDIVEIQAAGRAPLALVGREAGRTFRRWWPAEDTHVWLSRRIDGEGPGPSSVKPGIEQEQCPSN